MSDLHMNIQHLGQLLAFNRPLLDMNCMNNYEYVMFILDIWYRKEHPAWTLLTKTHIPGHQLFDHSDFLKVNTSHL